MNYTLLMLKRIIKKRKCLRKGVAEITKIEELYFDIGFLNIYAVKTP